MFYEDPAQMSADEGLDELGALLAARFLRRYVQRIELRRKKSEMAVTFDPAIREVFSTDSRAFREPAG